MRSGLKKGLWLAVLTALFSGVANYANKFTLTAVGDPLVHTTLKNALVGLLIVSFLVISKKLPKLRQLSKREISLLVGIAIVGGSIPFYLFFGGLAQTSAINASLIHKTLVFWVALIAIPLLKEKVSSWQWGALGLIFSANLLVGEFKSFRFSQAELMILGATWLWAIENVIVKKVLRRVDPDIVVGARMGLGSVVLLAWVVIEGKAQLMTQLTLFQYGLIGFTSLLLLGYVATWYRALKLVPVTQVATVLTVATLVTNGLTAVYKQSFPFQQVAGVVLVVAGVWFFSLWAVEGRVGKGVRAPFATE